MNKDVVSVKTFRSRDVLTSCFGLVSDKILNVSSWRHGSRLGLGSEGLVHISDDECLLLQPSRLIISETVQLINLCSLCYTICAALSNVHQT